MNKRNRILVLIDFSEYSGNLINFAFSISEMINAEVLFVHQIAGLAPAMADKEARNIFLNTEIEEAYSNLRKFSEALGKKATAFHVSQKPVLTILKELKSEYYFDWVFAGLKGTGILKRFFMGSTTISIVDNSDLLTVAVPVQSGVPVPEKLVVGVNTRYSLNKNQFATVLSALRDHIKELEFFTILENNENEIEAKNFLSALQIEYKDFNPAVQLYKGMNAFELLRDRVKHTADSFLILQQGSRSLRDQMLRKYMINELVYDAQTPLIVLST